MAASCTDGSPSRLKMLWEENTSRQSAGIPSAYRQSAQNQCFSSSVTISCTVITSGKFFVFLTGLYVENNTVPLKTVLRLIFKISFIETVCVVALESGIRQC